MKSGMLERIARLTSRVKTSQAHDPPALPDGERAYVVGDIHGRADLLDQIHTRITEDRESAPPGARTSIVYLGDYIDRGADSRGVIERLIAHPLPAEMVVHLAGNHEQAMLEFLDGASDGYAWLAFGGHETVVSYGIRLLSAQPAKARMAKLREELAQAVPEAHVRFLRSLALTHRIGDFLFVHAGVRPGRSLENQEKQDLLWIREPFLNCDRWLGRMIVHGHTVVDKPEIRANRICIDTGAYFSNRLTCLVVEGNQFRFLETKLDGFAANGKK